MNTPATFLRIESVAIFVTATFAYFSLGFNGWLYLLLFFSFDVSAVGYLANARLGAITYNAVHNFAPPLILGAAGLALRLPAAEAYALMWLAHVGFDRTVGFGLKYPERFGKTNVATFARARQRRSR